MERISTTSRLGAGRRARRVAALASGALLAAASLAPGPAGASGWHSVMAVLRQASAHHLATNSHRGTARHHARGAADQGCAYASTPTVGATNKAMRSAVVCLINQQRAAHGLPGLRVSHRLDRSAQGWTNSMVATQTFTHGADFSSRITAVGFVWQSAGENIATGFPTPQAVVSAWMASPDHCQNILNPTYSFVGTGINRHPVAAFGSGPATWTQDFALPMGGRAPSGNWGPMRGCPY